MSYLKKGIEIAGINEKLCIRAGNIRVTAEVVLDGELSKTVTFPEVIRIQAGCVDYSKVADWYNETLSCADPVYRKPLQTAIEICEGNVAALAKNYLLLGLLEASLGNEVDARKAFRESRKYFTEIPIPLWAEIADERTKGSKTLAQVVNVRGVDHTSLRDTCN